MWSVSSREVCQPRAEAACKPVTESNLSLYVPAQVPADMRASRCLAKSLSARAELPILSCNGMHVIVF